MIVVDSNVLAYHWLPGPRNADAEALVRYDAEWAAPVLWRSEFRNVLTGYIRAGHLTQTDAENAMHNAASCLLGGEHFVTDHAVFSLVAHSKCTAYDCEFVALAQALSTVVITEDRALLSSFPKYCYSLVDAVHGNIP